MLLNNRLRMVGNVERDAEQAQEQVKPVDTAQAQEQLKSAETKNSAVQAQKQVRPDETKLQKSVVAARKAVELQDTAASLKEKAKNAVNPKERLRLLQEAYDKEVEAFGQSKYAQRLQSGAWQGTVAGGGIGGGVALGLGTLVGTLVTGLVSVPTVALGGLVGAGVGSIHGPWLNFGNNDGKKAAMSEDETRSAAMKEAEKLDQAVAKGASTVPQPPQLEDPAEGQDNNHEHGDGAEQTKTQDLQKRKPRKLNVRSAGEAKVQPERKKPRKLEVRHAPPRAENG